MPDKLAKNFQKPRHRARDSAAGERQSPLISVAPEAMSGAIQSGSSDARPEPLNGDEAVLIDRAARRLHEQLRAFLEVLPSGVRSASGLARFLEIDRTTCQRLVFAATRPFAGLESIERLPGVRGLRRVVESTSSIDGFNEEHLASLATAIDRFDAAVRRIAGSQSALLRRMNAGPRVAARPLQHAHDAGLAARQRLFEAAAELTGRYSDTWLAIYVYHPSIDGRDDIVEVGRAHGLIGHHARTDAVPLTFHNFTSRRMSGKDAQDDGAPAHPFQGLNDAGTSGRTPDSVLTEFSTNPPPIVSARQPGEYLVQSIDTESSDVGRPIDLVFGTRNTMPHPASQAPRIEEAWAMINFPARRMHFDIFLHRDLARQCIPALDVHLWRPDFAAHVGDRWQTRFTEAPRLEVLGQGIKHAHRSSFTRLDELTRYLFQRLNLQTDRFIGYRCTVEYPIWRTGYCMSFDFNSGDE